MRTTQDKNSEITFFNNLAIKNGEYDAVSQNVYKKVAYQCHQALNRQPSSILEVGCGSGKFGKALARLGHKVVGIDISPLTVKNANQKQVAGYQAKVFDLETKKNFPAGTFSLILCPGVLHHLPNLFESPALANFHHWLKPKGLVVCWEPNGSNPVNKLSKLLFKLVYLFTRKEELATANETNHSYHQYLKAFSQSGFSLQSSKTFSDKSTVSFSNPAIKILVEIRWFLLCLINKLTPFPFSGVTLFMVFKKKPDS